jgi:hypothetical protein
MPSYIEYYRIHKESDGTLVAAMKYNKYLDRFNIPPVESKADYMNGMDLRAVIYECDHKKWKLVKVVKE